MPTTASISNSSQVDSTAQNRAAVKTSVRHEINALTALRFFPAFAVVFYHARDHFVDLRTMGDQFNFAHTVSFFFVLSGFILTLNYSRLADLKSASYFYLARFARIWPAHASSLIALVLLVPQVFKLNATLLPAFFCNLFLIQSWIPEWRVYYSFNAPAWSNSVETFFYITFPLLLMLLRKRWYMPLLAACFSVATMVTLCNILKLPEGSPTGLSLQGLIYINPLSRIVEFTSGMVTAFAFQKFLSGRSMNVLLATTLELAALASVLVLNVNSRILSSQWAPTISAPLAFWLQNSGFAVLASVPLILITAMEAGWVSRILKRPFLVMLGEISFAMYMLHCVFIAYRTVNFPHDQSLTSAALFFTTLLVASHFTWRYVERTMRKNIIVTGTKLLPFACAPDVQPQAMKTTQAKQNKPQNKKALIPFTIEGAVLCGLLYWSMPTIHAVSPQEATAMANNSAAADISFDSYVKLRSVSVQNSDTIHVKTVWEAMQPETIDSCVSLQVLDSQENILRQMDYLQDSRKQHVGTGTIWCEDVQLSINNPADAKFVAISVNRRRKHILHPSAASAAPRVSNDRVILPIQ